MTYDPHLEGWYSLRFSFYRDFCGFRLVPKFYWMRNRVWHKLPSGFAIAWLGKWFKLLWFL